MLRNDIKLSDVRKYNKTYFSFYKLSRIIYEQRNHNYSNQFKVGESFIHVINFLSNMWEGLSLTFTT